MPWVGSISGCALLMIGLMASFFSQERLLRSTTSEQSNKRDLLAPISEYSRFGVFLGYESFLASIIWVDGIMECADVLLVRGKDISTLVSQLKAVVALDTAWAYPPEFSGIVLEDFDGTPLREGLDILQDGVRRFPDKPVMAIVFSQRILQASWLDSQQRYDSASAVLMRVSRNPQTPAYARTLAFTLLADGRGVAASLRSLFRLWSTTKDPLIQLLYQSKFEQLLRQKLDFTESDAHCAAVSMQILASGDPGTVAAALPLLDALLDNRTRGSAMAALVDIQKQWEAATAPESGSSRSR